MWKKAIRWGNMIYGGDNYHWHPDEYVFKDSYPSYSEIKNIFAIQEEEYIHVEFKKHRVYVYDNEGRPICYFYELEETDA